MGLGSVESHSVLGKMMETQEFGLLRSAVQVQNPSFPTHDH